MKNISSEMSSDYFEKGDYYSKEGSQDENKAISKWEGELAHELNLIGEVKLQDFDNLLKGKIKDGVTLGRGGSNNQSDTKTNKTSNSPKTTKSKNKNGGTEHFPGIDLTFSAPKSVSILYEIGKDERVLEAHRKAVSSTLKFAEEHFVRTKVRYGSSRSKNTKIEYKTTGKAAIATYEHNTSRNLDPQLHTHAIIINATKTEDGKYRSIAPYKLYQNKMLLSRVFKHELKRNLTSIGYTIEQTHKDGSFELKEIPKEVRRHFSSRREEIEKALGDLFETKNAKTSALAALITRKAKKDYDKITLQTEWKERLGKFNLNLESVINTSKEHSKSLEPKKLSQEELSKLTKEAITYSINHLSERNSVFEKAKAIEEALKFNSNLSLELVSKELNLRLNQEKDLTEKTTQVSKLIIETDTSKQTESKQAKAQQQEKEQHPNLPKQTLLTKEDYIIPSKTLFTEKENIKLLNQGKEALAPIYIDTTNLKFNPNLNQGQKQSIILILETTDRVVGIQGSAGTGKTFMLKELNNLLTKEDYRIIGMAPSNSATLTLKQEANLKEANTLQSFLKQYDGLANNRETKQGLKEMREVFKNTVLIIDEASMISANQMNSLLKILEKLDTRAVLLGDTKQLASIEAGSPFLQLQQTGMKTAKLTEIIRQKDLLLKQAVEKAIKGEIKEAFNKIGNNIIEKEPKESIAFTAVKEYFKLSEEKRETTLILTPSNTTRKEINNLIRDEIKREGKLFTLPSSVPTTTTSINNQSILHTALEPKHLTSAERGEAFNYKLGEIVIFNKNYRTHDIQKDESFTIKEVKENSIILEREREGEDAGEMNVNIRKQKDSNKKTSSSMLNSKIIEFNIKSTIPELTVFEKQEKEISLGEKIRFLKSNKEKGIINSDTATVLQIDKQNNTITLQTEDKTNQTQREPITLSLTDPILRHIDYAYATTVYSAQGKTTDRVIAVLESKKLLTNQQTFYVEISRARKEAILIVDSKEEVQKTLIRNTGLKITALDASNSSSNLERLKQRIEGNSEISRFKKNEEINQSTNQKNFSPTTIQTTAQDKETNPQVQVLNQDYCPTTTKEYTYTQFNLETVNQRLASNATSVLSNILGSTKHIKTGNQYRYGKKGSLSVTVSGSKAGYWNDFETGEGGKSLLSLIQRERGLDFKESIEYGAGLVGLTESDKTKKVVEVRQEREQIEVKDVIDFKETNTKENPITELNKLQSEKPLESEELTTYQKNMTKLAGSIASKAETGKNTLAETYLKSRGITAELPNTIQFSSSVYIKKYDKLFPAMVVKVLDNQGKVQSVHLTLLDEKNTAKANVEQSKLKYGTIPNTINIELNTKKPTGNLTLIAEGIETALSIKSAFPTQDVKTVLDKSGFNKIDTTKTKDIIVLCLDNDLKDWKEDKIITNSIERLQNHNKQVWIAMPDAINNQKTDYNDILKVHQAEKGIEKGVNEIIKSIENAKECKVVIEKGIDNKEMMKDKGISSNSNTSNTNITMEKNSTKVSERENNVKVTSDIQKSRDFEMER